MGSHDLPTYVIQQVGQSPAHLRAVDTIQRVSRYDAEVLITGPTGVGKELYARLLHSRSTRAAHPFVPVNCGAIPADLFENEMFGRVTGAYTGAVANSDGLVALAEGGTLFLDEVNTLPPSCQVKLLRFLQFREYRRLGETRIRRADVRVVAAANTDLAEEVRLGQFRQDLYFRLRVVPIHIPPLCERRIDLVLLLDTFVKGFSERYGLPPLEFEPSAHEALRNYVWPGNVRELENCVRYLTCLQLGRPVRDSDLPFAASAVPPAPAVFTEALFDRPLREAKRELVADFEREYLRRALSASDGNVSGAARTSGKARRAFFELMRKHSMQRLSQFTQLRAKQMVIGSITHETEVMAGPDKRSLPRRTPRVVKGTGT
jgi:DNA-binding NtrC family response regulator